MIFERIRSGEASLRERFLERSRALEQVRSGILLSGALARDYVADPDGPDRATLLDRLRGLQAVSTQSLERYAASGSDRNGGLADLRGEVTAYWKVLNLMVEMAQRRRTPGLDAYFRRQLGQRREAMLLISGKVGVAVESEVRDRETELGRMYGQSGGRWQARSRW